MAESFAELLKLPDDELMEWYDRVAAHTVVGTAHYMNVLVWRHNDRQAKEMILLTTQMRRLTIIFTVAAIFSVALSIAMLTVMLLDFLKP